MLFENNQGAIHLSSSQELHKRNKNIDTKHHFVREKVKEGLIELKYIPTSNQLSDFVTKGLGNEQFKRLLNDSVVIITDIKLLLIFKFYNSYIHILFVKLY